MPRPRKAPPADAGAFDPSNPWQCGRCGACSIVKDIFGEELEDTCENCGYMPIAGEDDGSFWINGVRYPPGAFVEDDGSFWLDGKLHKAKETPYPRWSQP